MPNIEQLNWSKLQPKAKDATTYSCGRSEGYKKSTPKVNKTIKQHIAKKKKIKAIDKTIWSDNYDNMQHLRSIMRESSN